MPYLDKNFLNKLQNLDIEILERLAEVLDSL